MAADGRQRRRAAVEATRLLFGEEDHMSDSSDDDLEDLISEEAEESNEEVNETGDGDFYEMDDYVNTLNEEHLEAVNDSDSSDESDLESEIDESLRASSGKEWTILHEGSRPGRAPQRNVLLSGRPGVKPGIHPNTPSSAFLLFMDDIIDYAVRFTNLEARRVVTAYNRQNRKKLHWKKISRQEMDAFLGLNILLGVYRSRQLDLESMWIE